MRCGLSLIKRTKRMPTCLRCADGRGLAVNRRGRNYPKEKRETLLSNAGARQKTAPAAASDEQLLSALDSCSLATWQAQTDALPAQFDKALAAAIS